MLQLAARLPYCVIRQKISLLYHADTPSHIFCLMPCLEAFRTGSLRDKSPKKSIIISFKTRPLDLLNILVAEKGTDNLDFEFTSNILALSYRGIILKARCFLLLYDVIVKNKRIAAFLDVLESLTGFGLAIFLHMHMLFVSTIHFGRNVFDGLTEFLDGYYLAHIGIPPLILIFFIHLFKIFLNKM